MTSPGDGDVSVAYSLRQSFAAARPNTIVDLTSSVELRHLRYFLAVAETLSFSRAGERLRVAQPALSRQVRDLESELGVRLFERNRVRVQLTDAGRTFQAHVSKLLLQVEVAVDATRNSARGARGKLVIGNDWQLSTGIVPQTVAVFREHYPDVQVSFAELKVHEQLPAIRAGTIHVGFVPSLLIGERHDVELLKVLEAERVAVLPASHRFAKGRSIRLRDLKQESWVTLDEKVAPGFRAYFQRFCRLAGFTPILGETASTISGLLAHIASNAGISVLPRHILPKGEEMLCYVATDCDPLEICAVWRNDDQSAVLANFLELLRQSLTATELAKIGRTRIGGDQRKTA